MIELLPVFNGMTELVVGGSGGVFLRMVPLFF
jgi:hypothetical protein